MSEKEKCDPTQEAQKIAVGITREINQKSARLRLMTTAVILRGRTGTGVAKERKKSHHVAEERRGDGHEKTENRERAAWRERCFVAIISKLGEKGIVLSEKTRIILAEVMAKTPGEWDQYNGDPEGVDLGTIDFDPATQTITIRFVSCGYDLKERILTLR